MSDFEIKSPSSSDFNVVPLRDSNAAVVPMRRPPRPDDLRLLAERRRLLAEGVALDECLLAKFEAAHAAYIAATADVIDAWRASLARQPKPGDTPRTDGSD